MFEALDELIDNSREAVFADVTGHKTIEATRESQIGSSDKLQAKSKTSISFENSIPSAEVGVWPAPGSEDTELGVLMEPEVGHGEAEVYGRVQA
jgi:hypothetical protein